MYLASFLSFALLVTYTIYEAEYTTKKFPPATSTTYNGIGLKPRGPAEPKWDMSHKRFTSLDAAKEHIREGMLFPSYTGDRKLGVISVEKTKAPNKRAVVVMYEKGLQFNATPLSYEDGQAHLQNFATNPRSVRLTIHGLYAYGTEQSKPGESGPRGQPSYVSYKICTVLS